MSTGGLLFVFNRNILSISFCIFLFAIIVSAYNIKRNISTDIHAKRQRKLSSVVNFNKQLIRYASKINFETSIHNQLFNTEDKKIENKFADFKNDIEDDIGADELKKDVFNELRMEELEKNKELIDD